MASPTNDIENMTPETAIKNLTDAAIIIKDAIVEAKNVKNAPSVIILDTVKGYGCDFAEGIDANHHMIFVPEQMDKAIDAQARKLEEARVASSR